MRVPGFGSKVAARGAAAGLALVSFVACTGRSTEEPATPTVAATMIREPTPEEAVPVGDPGVTVENVVQACREKDGNLLRSFIAGPVEDEEIQALFDRGIDVRLAGRTPALVEDGLATVTVRLDVRRDGETELVERTWQLERGADGVWRFSVLPDCF